MNKNIPFDKDMFVYFDESTDIPELVYRFNYETYALEAWPSLDFFYVEKDNSRFFRLSSPDVSIKNSTLDEILERDKMYKKVLYYNKFRRGWGRKRHKFQIHIQKWLSYIPKDVKKTFLDWPYKSIYTWKAMKLSAQSEYYFQLCQTNPVLAYLLIQRDQWDTTNDLSNHTLETVLQSKQGRITELLGFDKKVRKSLSKLNTLPFDYNSTYQDFASLKKFLNDPVIIKLLNALPNITKGLYDFLTNAHSYGWAYTIQNSFLLEILHLETIHKLDMNQNKKVNDRFYKEETRSYSCFSMILLWYECMNHNRNWSIKTVNSLLSHEELMIKDVTRLEEETIKNDPKIFNPAPIPYHEWNQGELFAASRELTITPIANSYELFLAGKEFNNCAYTYLSDILEGEYYAYILNGKNNEKYMLSVVMVTEELAESGYYELSFDRCYKSSSSKETQNIIWQLQEVKGIGNSEPPDYVWKYIDQWFEFVR
jgi:hypothetical protein